MGKTFLRVFLIMGLLTSPAMAEQSPMGKFLRSVTTLYITSEECKHIRYLHSDYYSGIIKSYLTSFYGSEIPYWALPEVNVYAANQQECVDNLSENVAAYEVSSRQFAYAYPNEPLPPSLPHVAVLHTYAPGDNSKYIVTAPVITQ